MTAFDSGSRKYYHARLMSGPAAVHRIEDPFAFALAASLYGGQVAFAAMPRLQDRLAGSTGAVDYLVRGKVDQRQQPLLEVEITGNLSMRCSRCLAPLDFPLRLKSRVLLVQPGSVPGEDDDPESPEWIEAGPELDVLALVEDEILLGLPLAVRHEQGGCSNSSVGGGNNRRDDNPFSKLATLLNTK